MPSPESNQRTIAAGKFKNRCLALMDEVHNTGIEIIITKHGKPVSRLVPVKQSKPQMWGRYQEFIRITGDIVESCCPLEEWEVINNPQRVLDPDLPPFNLECMPD